MFAYHTWTQSIKNLNQRHLNQEEMTALAKSVIASDSLLHKKIKVLF